MPPTCKTLSLGPQQPHPPPLVEDLNIYINVQLFIFVALLICDCEWGPSFHTLPSAGFDGFLFLSRKRAVSCSAASGPSHRLHVHQYRPTIYQYVALTPLGCCSEVVRPLPPPPC